MTSACVLSKASSVEGLDRAPGVEGLGDASVVELLTTRLELEKVTRLELGIKTGGEVTVSMVENTSEEKTMVAMEDDTTGLPQVPNPGWHPVLQYACWNPLVVIGTALSIFDENFHTNSRMYCSSLQKPNLCKSGL